MPGLAGMTGTDPGKVGGRLPTVYLPKFQRSSVSAFQRQGSVKLMSQISKERRIPRGKWREIVLCRSRCVIGSLHGKWMASGGAQFWTPRRLGADEGGRVTGFAGQMPTLGGLPLAEPVRHAFGQLTLVANVGYLPAKSEPLCCDTFLAGTWMVRPR